MFHSQDGSTKGRLGGLVGLPTSLCLSSNGLLANVPKSSMPVFISLFPKHWAPSQFLSWQTKSSSRPAIDEGLSEGPWHAVLLQGSFGQGRHMLWPLLSMSFPSGLEMSPWLEHNATSGLLLLWFQTLVPFSLSCPTGLCAIERGVLSKPTWGHSPQVYLSLTSKHRFWQPSTSMTKAHPPSPKALSHPMLWPNQSASPSPHSQSISQSAVTAF